MKRSRVVGAATLGLGLVGLLTAPSAQAIDLYGIHGTVTDTYGEPLAEARVDNGGQTTYTDSDGRYRLGQTLPGSYTVRASRNDCGAAVQHRTILVPQDSQVDFTLYCTE